ncbi:hypothetical protein HIM_06566 [Hirsutella minnesotensis 3608]|uniref:Uncharacterized protein n=1 Tax=Hirsutella minnesotensis 3608 TaxID=1043627 RepID=A0A0F7ZZF2_9HYPO|nr:hypothetical protein HIM_06566 [Hirsutella minnesotensis 3608]
MASLARGLLLPCRQSLFRLQSRPVVRSTNGQLDNAALCKIADPKRFFVSSLRQRLASPSKPNIKSIPKPTPPTAATAAAPKHPTIPVQQVVERSRYAFVKHLAVKPTPTILYEAPSHFWFYFSCWSAGLTLIAWTALTGRAVINQPEGVPQWVKVVYGITYALLASMGFYLIARTPNVMKTIRVLPPAAAATAAAHTIPGSVIPSLRVECVVKRMVPFVRPKVINASTSEVTLEERLSLPDEFMPEYRRLELEREEEARRQQLHKYDMDHLLTMPFRRVGRAFSAVYHGTRSAFTDSGFRYIVVQGKRYKIDVTAGFSHDGFRTLERLVAMA